MCFYFYMLCALFMGMCNHSHRQSHLQNSQAHIKCLPLLLSTLFCEMEFLTKHGTQSFFQTWLPVSLWNYQSLIPGTEVADMLCNVQLFAWLLANQTEGIILGQQTLTYCTVSQASPSLMFSHIYRTMPENGAKRTSTQTLLPKILLDSVRPKDSRIFLKISSKIINKNQQNMAIKCFHNSLR